MAVRSASGRKNSRGRRGVPRYGAMADINMTPFIDVMLVLLIIFMVAAPLLTTGVSVDLPQTSAAALNVDRKPIADLAQRAGPALSDGPADRRRRSRAEASGGVPERRGAAHLPARLQGRSLWKGGADHGGRDRRPDSRRWRWSPSRPVNSRERLWTSGGHIGLGRPRARCTATMLASPHPRLRRRRRSSRTTRNRSRSKPSR